MSMRSLQHLQVQARLPHLGSLVVQRVQAGLLRPGAVDRLRDGPQRVHVLAALKAAVHWGQRRLVSGQGGLCRVDGQACTDKLPQSASCRRYAGRSPAGTGARSHLQGAR